MVLLSTHDICFGWEIRKLFYCYALLTIGLLFHKLTNLSNLDMGLVIRKPVSGIFDQVWVKAVYLATETSWNI